MTSFLDPHLEQITLSSQALSTLPFAPPKIFTNAILHSTDIVSLIRDTDAHERALFTVPSTTTTTSTATVPDADKKGRISIAPRRNTAVYSVLGGDMVEKLRRGGAGGVGRGVGGVPMPTGDVDVEVLLMGAERLGAVYHIPGAAERIERARERFEQLSESLENYEALVEAQKAELDLLHGRSGGGGEVEDEDDAMDGVVYEDETPYLRPGEEMVTEEMIRREEEEIGELERKKVELEARIRNTDRR
ncbi:DASH complex subunit Spc34 [Morchella snyderi]|nr:DASH complex subunit Spc34 [Morchella snyderi]